MDLDKKDSNYWISKEKWDKLDAFQDMKHKKFCKKYKKQIRRYLKRLANETKGMSAMEYLDYLEKEFRK